MHVITQFLPRSENKMSIIKTSFYIESNMSIISSITYKIYKYLINQASVKVKLPSFIRYDTHIGILDFKGRIMRTCIVSAAMSP